MPVGGDFDIARLNIAVQNRRFARMQVSQGIAHGCANQDGVFLGNGAQAFHALT